MPQAVEVKHSAISESILYLLCKMLPELDVSEQGVVITLS